MAQYLDDYTKQEIMDSCNYFVSRLGNYNPGQETDEQEFKGRALTDLELFEFAVDMATLMDAYALEYMDGNNAKQQKEVDKTYKYFKKFREQLEGTYFMIKHEKE